MNIEKFCGQLEALLCAAPAGDERIRVAIQAVRQAFRVKEDEVAILALDPRTEVMRFLWPAKLKNSGLVPLNSPDSLAARTAREKKAFLNNHFASAQHTSIFEHFRLDPTAGEKPPPIQKIISAPLASEGSVKGVIQVCRKGIDPAGAGSDFSKAELAALVQISQVLAPHI